MGAKLSWTGMFFLTAGPALGLSGVFNLVGGILFAIGVVLVWLDR